MNYISNLSASIKMYKVKEIYYTLQGEGYYTGRAAVFVRFTGCNLWSGKEKDRKKAICNFCDTDFVDTNGFNGGNYSLDQLCIKIMQQWPLIINNLSKPFIVFTGGEPALQLDQDLINALHNTGFEIAIETNGTMALPKYIDWICVSPKANTELVIKKGNELKLIYPQLGAMPEQFQDLKFWHYWLQPMDSKQLKMNTEKAILYCMANPQWRLSLQTHKLIGIK